LHWHPVREGRRVGSVWPPLAGYLVIVHSTVLLTGLAGHLSVHGLATVVTVVFLIATWLAKLKSGANMSGPPAAVASSGGSGIAT
jgi:hypothetical protein